MKTFMQNFDGGLFYIFNQKKFYRNVQSGTFFVNNTKSLKF